MPQGEHSDREQGRIEIHLRHLTDDQIASFFVLFDSNQNTKALHGTGGANGLRDHEVTLSTK